MSSRYPISSSDDLLVPAFLVTDWDAPDCVQWRLDHPDWFIAGTWTPGPRAAKVVMAPPRRALAHRDYAAIATPSAVPDLSGSPVAEFMALGAAARLDGVQAETAVSPAPGRSRGSDPARLDPELQGRPTGPLALLERFIPYSDANQEWVHGVERRFREWFSPEVEIAPLHSSDERGRGTVVQTQSAEKPTSGATQTGGAESGQTSAAPPVVAPPAAQLPASPDPTGPATPAVAQPGAATLSPGRRSYILDGDGKGNGGHGPGRGVPGKSEFPADWTDAKIAEAIEDVANSPTSTRTSTIRGRTEVLGLRDGVEIKVIIGADGKSIVTGYPINTPQNPNN